METNYVGKLQETMVKYGIKPNYEVVENTTGTHINAFRIRLTCRLPQKDQIFSVDGEGLSKRNAKQMAASVFIKTHLEENHNNNPPQNRSQEKHVCKINVNVLSRVMLLQLICTKNNLEKPVFVDVLQTGPSHSPKFIIACKVGDSRTEGEGPKKNDAKLEAASKMIQLLLEAQEIYEIFEAAQSESLVMSNEIVCLTDGLTRPQCPNLISIFGRRRLPSNPRDCQKVVKKESTKNIAVSHNGIKSPDTLERILPNLIKTTHKIEQEVVKSLNESMYDLTLSKLQDNSEGKLIHNKAKSESLSNLSKCVSNGGNQSPTTSDDSRIRSCRIEAMNRIDKALKNAEDQLYNAILDMLPQRDEAHKKVVILSNEFDVCINRSCPLTIHDGNGECNDKSIRIACLTKVLLDLKEHIRNDFEVLEKSGKRPM